MSAYNASIRLNRLKKSSEVEELANETAKCLEDLIKAIRALEGEVQLLKKRSANS